MKTWLSYISMYFPEDYIHGPGHSIQQMMPVTVRVRNWSVNSPLGMASRMSGEDGEIYGVTPPSAEEVFARDIMYKVAPVSSLSVGARFE